jgi:hypothetical protein
MLSFEQHQPWLSPAELKGRSDILALGIDKFNEECRSIVMR